MLRLAESIIVLAFSIKKLLKFDSIKLAIRLIKVSRLSPKLIFFIISKSRLDLSNYFFFLLIIKFLIEK